MNRKDFVWFAFVSLAILTIIIFVVFDVLVVDEGSKNPLLIKLSIGFTIWIFINYIFHRSEKFKATGVMDFLDSVTIFEDVLRTPDYIEAKTDKEREQVLAKFREKHGGMKIVSGVVCDEEITAETDGFFITVYVTKPETERAFEKIPKYWKELVTVVRN